MAEMKGKVALVTGAGHRKRRPPAGGRQMRGAAAWRGRAPGRWVAVRRGGGGGGGVFGSV